MSLVPRFVSVRLIVHCVAEAWGIDDRAIYARRRGTGDEPRGAAYWIANQVCQESLSAIGRLIGGRDHSTILHGVQTAERRRAADPDYAARLEGAKRAVEILGAMHVAERFADPDVVAIAQRVMRDPLGRAVTRVSNVELIAVSARLLDLEDVAGGVFQLLAHIDALKSANGSERPAIARAAGPLVETLASALAALGYAPEPTEEPQPHEQQEPQHAVS